MDWQTCGAVDRHPAKLGGAWCFAGTRVPVVSLFEHLDGGSTIDEFLEWFRDVHRDQPHAVLAFATATLRESARVA